MAALVVHFGCDDVAVRPGQASRLDAVAVGGFQALIDRQVLVELPAGEDIVAEVHHVDINVTAAGGIVGVAFGRSQSVIAEAEKIVVIDLIMQGGGSGPNQRAHAAIADGQAVVAARRGGVEREVGARDQAR